MWVAPQLKNYMFSSLLYINPVLLQTSSLKPISPPVDTLPAGRLAAMQPAHSGTARCRGARLGRARGQPGTRTRARPRGLSAGTRPGGRRAPSSAAAAAGVSASRQGWQEEEGVRCEEWEGAEGSQAGNEKVFGEGVSFKDARRAGPCLRESVAAWAPRFIRALSSVPFQHPERRTVPRSPQSFGGRWRPGCLEPSARLRGILWEPTFSVAVQVNTREASGNLRESWRSRSRMYQGHMQE